MAIDLKSLVFGSGAIWRYSYKSEFPIFAIRYEGHGQLVTDICLFYSQTTSVLLYSKRMPHLIGYIDNLSRKFEEDYLAVEKCQWKAMPLNTVIVLANKKSEDLYPLLARNKVTGESFIFIDHDYSVLIHPIPQNPSYSDVRRKFTSDNDLLTDEWEILENEGAILLEQRNA